MTSGGSPIAPMLQQQMSSSGNTFGFMNAAGQFAPLMRSTLSEINFSKANFSYANLCGVKLRKINLNGTNLFRANLSEADIREININKETNLSETILSGIQSDIRFIQFKYIGSRDGITTYCFDLDIIWCGCFRGSLDEFEERVEKTHKNNLYYLTEYRDMIEYIRKDK